jgi:hypothetical protein
MALGLAVDVQHLADLQNRHKWPSADSNNDQVYPRDVAPPRLGEGVLPRDSCEFSGRWGPARRCLVAECFNRNNCELEKPRKTSKYA